MSTPHSSRATERPRTAVVPHPRQPVEPPLAPRDVRPPEHRATDGGEPPGVYGRHPWLTPVTLIAMVVAVFVAMVVLTWLAGGTTPFDR